MMEMDPADKAEIDTAIAERIEQDAPRFSSDPSSPQAIARWYYDINPYAEWARVEVMHEFGMPTLDRGLVKKRAANARAYQKGRPYTIGPSFKFSKACVVCGVSLAFDPSGGPIHSICMDLAPYTFQPEQIAAGVIYDQVHQDRADKIKVLRLEGEGPRPESPFDPVPRGLRWSPQRWGYIMPAFLDGHLRPIPDDFEWVNKDLAHLSRWDWNGLDVRLDE